MPDLHLIGVHEDGRHLVLASREGEEFALPLDDRLRSLLRRHSADDPARMGRSPRGGADEPLRPTEVQAMIRAGADAQEAAERAGWPVEKVHRYEGPILAERAHVATLAGRSHVRDRSSAGSGHPTTLADRVQLRLAERGVESESTEWDAWRSEDGQWTVDVTFLADGRRRTASWHFSRSAMTVEPVDDEARRLSGDEAPPTPPRRSEPGLGRTSEAAAPRPETGLRRDDDTDLVMSMRERSAARSRRRTPRRPVGDGGHGQTDGLPVTFATDRSPEPVDAPTQPEPFAAVRAVGGDEVRNDDHLDLRPTAHDEPELHWPQPSTDTSEDVSADEDAITVTTDGPHRRVTAPVAHTDPVPLSAEHSPAASPVEPAEPVPGAVARDRSVASDTVDEPELPLLADDEHADEEPTRRATAPVTTPAPSADPADGADDEPGDDATPRRDDDDPRARVDSEVAGSPDAPQAAPPAPDVADIPDALAEPASDQQAPAEPAPATPVRSGRASRRARGKTRSSATAEKNPSSSARSAAPEAAQNAGSPTPHEATVHEQPVAEETAAPRPAPAPRKRPKGRASVPAWDDIMFGAKHPTDD